VDHQLDVVLAIEHSLGFRGNVDQRAQPAQRFVEQHLLHHRVHGTSLRSSEPASPATGAIVGARLLSVPGVAGLMVVAIGLVPSNSGTEPFARHHHRVVEIEIGIVDVCLDGEQRTLHQGDVGRRATRVAECLCQPARRPHPPYLSDGAI
jgi:hypothetical protein